MKDNDIKKELYKQKPRASMYGVDKDNNACYQTSLEDGTSITFTVPSAESENFEDDMPAQLLIRWIDKK